jgi:hypothetical protein
MATSRVCRSGRPPASALTNAVRSVGRSSFVTREKAIDATIEF